MLWFAANISTNASWEQLGRAFQEIFKIAQAGWSINGKYDIRRNFILIILDLYNGWKLALWRNEPKGSSASIPRRTRKRPNNDLISTSNHCIPQWNIIILVDHRPSHPPPITRRKRLPPRQKKRILQRPPYRSKCPLYLIISIVKREHKSRIKFKQICSMEVSRNAAQEALKRTSGRQCWIRRWIKKIRWWGWDFRYWGRGRWP